MENMIENQGFDESVSKIRVLWGEFSKGSESELDFEMIEAITCLFPEKITELLEDSWFNVEKFDKDEIAAEGRKMIELPKELEDVFLLTKEQIDEKESAYTVWMK
jgi:hypothetical protein